MKPIDAPRILTRWEVREGIDGGPTRRAAASSHRGESDRGKADAGLSWD